MWWILGGLGLALRACWSCHKLPLMAMNYQKEDFKISGPRALKGQKLLARGIAPGLRLASIVRPERAKALIDLRYVLELLPFL
jgi:hypothetical protein